jgi:tetratricopeptide (TPR) repeat protein
MVEEHTLFTSLGFRQLREKRRIGMSKSAKRTLYLAFGIALGLTLGALAVQAHADGSEQLPAASEPSDPDYAAGKAAIAGGNWKAAIEAFGRAAALAPANADVQNHLGYAHRKAGNLDIAFKHYGEALRLEPGHRGAHEYIGEAYLMQGDLGRAKEHLATLDRICLFGCDEHRHLMKAVAEYERLKR